MKFSELEDADQIVTKEYLDAKLAQLEVKLAELEVRLTDRDLDLDDFGSVKFSNCEHRNLRPSAR